MFFYAISVEIPKSMHRVAVSSQPVTVTSLVKTDLHQTNLSEFEFTFLQSEENKRNTTKTTQPVHLNLRKWNWELKRDQAFTHSTVQKRYICGQK